MSSQNANASFVAGLVTGSLIGASLALLLAPQSGEKTRGQIRDKSLALKDEARDGLSEAGQQAQGQVSAWQEKGQAVTEAIGRSKDSLIQAVSDSNDRIGEAVGSPKTKN
jgi:gas vesicle protein